MLAVLNLGVHYADTVIEKRRQVATRNVTVLVDGRGQYASAVGAIPSGVVGPAPEERDPKWCPADDHRDPLRPSDLRAGLIPCRLPTRPARVLSYPLRGKDRVPRD